MRRRAFMVASIAVIATAMIAALVYHRRPAPEPNARLAAFVRLDKTNVAVKDALEQFLMALHEKRYADAVELYGGSYETLQYWNPSIDANDRIALWRNGCEQNGLNCLVATAMEVGEQSTDGSYVVNAWLRGADGKEFSIPSHVGGVPDAEESRRNVFPFTVVKSADGTYLVQTMPVYTP